MDKSIRVNCVSPSFVDTPMMKNLFEQAPHMKSMLLSQLPIRPIGRRGC
jgi:NAD(P)-dependent dehydrogenase (short-subunit alcohol dehydrogenase family)